MFPTDRALSAKNGRKLEQLAELDQQLSSLELMRRAGRGAWQWISSQPCDGAVMVLCGPGNNGGDGLVLARQALLQGYTVFVRLKKQALEHASVATRQVFQDWIDAGGTVLDDNADWPESVALIVDAMFGTGLSRPLENPYKDWLEWANRASVLRYALDISSGLQADSGALLGQAFKADQSLCFMHFKLGQLQAPARDCSGRLIPIDLGIAASVVQRVEVDLTLLEAENLVWPELRAADSHKYCFGEIGVLGGDTGMPGAARLCAEAALRGGAGIVRVVCAPENRLAMLMGRPELLLGGLPFARHSYPQVLVIGPGLGTGGFAGKELIWAFNSDLPKVIDADALQTAWLEAANLSQAVLTPHPGEAARLLQCSVKTVQQDRQRALALLVERYACVVVLKGAGTLIGAPGRIPALLKTADSGLASAGMGDVLSGMIAALMGQGLSPRKAACGGVFWHAAAAQYSAEAIGSPGYLASDLIEALPRVRQQLQEFSS